MIQQKPDWLRITLSDSESFRKVREPVKEKNIHTICQEGRCPNVAGI